MRLFSIPVRGAKQREVPGLTLLRLIPNYDGEGGETVNLWLRFFWVIFWAWRSPRREFLTPSTVRFRVWPLDLDLNFHVNNGRYLTLMDLGRLDLMARTGLLREIFRRRWMPVVASIQITFRRSLDLFQTFELRTQVLTWDEKWFYLGQEFYVGDKVYARALVKAAIRAADGTLPTEKILALLGDVTDVPQPPEAWRVWIQNAKA